MDLFTRQNFAKKKMIVWNGMLAYYKLDNNATDAIGAYNGTAFSMVYGTGKINPSSHKSILIDNTWLK